mgnify:FL=1
MRHEIGHTLVTEGRSQYHKNSTGERPESALTSVNSDVRLPHVVQDIPKRHENKMLEED